MLLLDIVLCSEIRESNWWHFSLQMNIRLSDWDSVSVCAGVTGKSPRLGAVSRSRVMITAVGSFAYILRIGPCPLWRSVALTPSIKLECLPLYLPCLFAEPSWYYFCSLSNCFVIMGLIWFPLRSGLNSYSYSHTWLEIFGATSARKDALKWCEREICAWKVFEIVTFMTWFIIIQSRILCVWRRTRFQAFILCIVKL